MSEVTGVAEVMRWTRYTAEAFANPQQFSSPQEYLAALDECLVELCNIKGIQPPDLEQVWS